ncbi:hypothetical protein PMIN06_007059 [Paraphaeosphaeria minitans]|uniref:Uncharacterized protein n=1 Tax=Paraphaeosphaeria minitans TaxID=565426 RepID=A0A9P6KVC1_9PLEO|nr:hypothetical protein PMIN01_02892 [Paraphaeosphaeria minitans]
MPATPAATPKPKQKAGAATPNSTPSTPTPAQPTPDNKDKTVRLHITPFNPTLLKAYIPPSVLPVAKNISYHALETFPEKGFGYVELPAMEAQKLKKKLNGSTLKGSKVRIEEAKPEKRKAGDVVDVEAEEAARAAKRAKKEKKRRKRKEDGVLEGVQLPEERKVKRGWTEVPVKGKKERTEKKEKKDKKEEKRERKKSKYTKEPELLFKAKLTPVAANELARKDKKDKKKDKKDKSKQEVVVHEFEKNTKTPSFLKAAAVSTDKKAAVDYVNDKGWVDEEGNMVEPETTKAKNKRVLELVEPGPDAPSPKSKKKAPATPSPNGSPAPKSAKKDKKKAKKATPPPESSESEESSVVSSSSDSDSDSDSAASAGAPEPSSPAPASTPAKAKSNTPEIAIQPSFPTRKEIHPLEALFKKPKPAPLLTPSTPAKGLAPINTSFSFFDGEPDADADVDMENGENAAVPFTPQTQRDIEWRGLRSAAPTPDTAAIGRRFSFPWRNGSQEADGDEEEPDADVEASTQLSNNTKANATASQLADVAEVEEEEAEVGGAAGAEEETGEEGEKEESEFRKWFWENQGGLNRAWKRRRKDAVKTKRGVENRRAAGGARRGA